MAKSRRTVAAEERVRHVYFNKWGEQEFEVGQLTRESEVNGRETVETIHEHRETASGGTVDVPAPGDGGREQPALQTCDICYEERGRDALSRRGRKPTMSPADTMRKCFRCRATLCGDHSLTSARDNQVRCKHCHRWHRLYKGIVEGILYTGR